MRPFLDQTWFAAAVVLGLAAACGGGEVSGSDAPGTQASPTAPAPGPESILDRIDVPTTDQAYDRIRDEIDDTNVDEELRRLREEIEGGR